MCFPPLVLPLSHPRPSLSHSQILPSRFLTPIDLPPPLPPRAARGSRIAARARRPPRVFIPGAPWPSSPRFAGATLGRPPSPADPHSHSTSSLHTSRSYFPPLSTPPNLPPPPSPLHPHQHPIKMKPTHSASSQPPQRPFIQSLHQILAPELLPLIPLPTISTFHTIITN